MLTRSELTRTRVAMVLEDSGGRHRVTTERVRGGQVRMTCTCTASVAEGWCAHQLELLCLRYGGVVEKDEDAEFHFEDIVLGTPLAETADEVDIAMVACREALAAIAGRTVGDFSAASLVHLSDHAADLGDASRTLASALGRLMRRLAAARSLPAAD
jgi:hypothetical protein